MCGCLTVVRINVLNNGDQLLIVGNVTNFVAEEGETSSSFYLSYLPKGYCKQKQNWQWQVEKDMQYIIDVHTNSNPPPGFKLSMTALFVKWIWVVIVLVADMTQK